MNKLSHHYMPNSTIEHFSTRSAKVEAKVTVETKAALSKKCWAMGISESDYISRLLESSLFGEEGAVENFRRQLRLITQNGDHNQYLLQCGCRKRISGCLNWWCGGLLC